MIFVQQRTGKTSSFYPNSQISVTIYLGAKFLLLSWASSQFQEPSWCLCSASCLFFPETDPSICLPVGWTNSVLEAGWISIHIPVWNKHICTSGSGTEQCVIMPDLTKHTNSVPILKGSGQVASTKFGRRQDYDSSPVTQPIHSFRSAKCDLPSEKDVAPDGQISFIIAG